jgi:hypothetical protein
MDQGHQVGQHQTGINLPSSKQYGPQMRPVLLARRNCIGKSAPLRRLQVNVLRFFDQSVIDAMWLHDAPLKSTQSIQRK